MRPLASSEEGRLATPESNWKLANGALAITRTRGRGHGQPDLNRTAMRRTALAPCSSGDKSSDPGGEDSKEEAKEDENP